MKFHKKAAVHSSGYHINFLLMLCIFSAYGCPVNAIDNAGNNKINHMYIRTALGYSTFDMHALNEQFIKGFSDVLIESIKGGAVFDIEAGLSAYETFKAGISYVQEMHLSESCDTDTFTDRDANTAIWDKWYIDTRFRGVGLGVWYYLPLLPTRLRIVLGGKGVFGLGSVNLGMGERPSPKTSNYGYDNFKAPGAGITASVGAEYPVIKNITAGIFGGYAILRTSALRNTIDNSPWLRPPSNPQPINLDFSGFFVKAFVGVEL
jgi:hypothetical protein